MTSNQRATMLRLYTKVAIRLSVVAMVAAISGCQTTKPSGECLGTEYLLVRNDSGQSIDVVQSNGTGVDVIGSAPPGVSQLQFPAGRARGGRYYARGNGTAVVTEHGRSGNVRIEVGCNGLRG